MTIKESVRAHLTQVHVIHVIPLQAIRECHVHYPNLQLLVGTMASNSMTIKVTKVYGTP
jgi:hypothetical protein